MIVCTCSRARSNRPRNKLTIMFVVRRGSTHTHTYIEHRIWASSAQPSKKRQCGRSERLKTPQELFRDDLRASFFSCSSQYCSSAVRLDGGQENLIANGASDFERRARGPVRMITTAVVPPVANKSLTKSRNINSTLDSRINLRFANGLTLAVHLTSRLGKKRFEKFQGKSAEWFPKHPEEGLANTFDKHARVNIWLRLDVFAWVHWKLSRLIWHHVSFITPR